MHRQTLTTAKRLLSAGRLALALVLVTCLSVPPFAPAAQSSGSDEGGGIIVQAKSSLPGLTNGSLAYSFDGAAYTLYSDEACACEVTSLVLGDDGAATYAGLPEGTYFLKQSSPPQGYAADGETHETVVVAGETAVISLSLEPKHASAGLLVRMENLETQNAASVGGATLQGAEFEVSYFDTNPDDGEATPSRTWTFASDENGEVLLDENHFVQGDALFTDETGLHTLALGHYVIREKSPSLGYVPSDEVRSFNIEDDGTGETVMPFSQTQTFSCQVVRGDIYLQKVDEAGAGLEGIPFVLSSLNSAGEVVEEHVVVSGSDGVVSTSATAHSTLTNANDAALVGEGSTRSADDAKLIADAGVWFSTDAAGAISTPDDTLGALPYGTYRLEELPCAANAGMTLVESAFSIRENEEAVDLGQLVDKASALNTWVYDAKDTDKRIAAEDGVVVNDSIELSNLVEGTTYELRTTLVEASTKEPIESGNAAAVQARTSFVAQESSLTQTVELAFDASSLAGHGLFVVDELLLGGKVIATNAESLGEAQYVEVSPKIATSARDEADGDSFITSTEATIIDEVSFEGLKPGAIYKLDALLMDKETGSVARDGEGEAISGSREFVCEASSGSMDVEISLDTSLVGGHDVVVFEKLREEDDTEIAAHEDIDDAAQTLKTVGMDTVASDKADGDGYYDANAEYVTVVDKVSCTNLEMGCEYALTTTLMDKTSKAALETNGAKVRTTTTFTAHTASDVVEVELGFDPREHAAGSIVVYEVLSYKGNEVARHADIDDEDQTLTALAPAEESSAAEGVSSDDGDVGKGASNTMDASNETGKSGYVATGDTTQLGFALLASALLTAASALYALRYRRLLAGDTDEAG